jgi:DNA-binding NtrC family response regulator
VSHLSNVDTAKSESGLGHSATGRPEQSSPATVAVWDQAYERLQSINEIIKSCGANTVLLQDPAQISSVERSFSKTVALVALGDRTAQGAESFAIIRALKLKGFRVISYEDDVLSWPIGTRCRALLSGCSSLFDSSERNFPDELRQAVTRALQVATESHFEEQLIKEQMEALGIIGESAEMMAVFRWVMRVSALSDFPVLISGETGTGKELIANALHRLDSKRSKGPFIAANCSVISAGLAESELFGHRRGSFTGADSDRKGLFRAAEGGILFLDEIGELSEALQAKLLRVLQEQKVLGVGFDQEVSIDVRVIAATNRSLEQMVKQRRFREDLYHRLNVLAVNIPPLRDRQEDLQPLTEHFLKKYSALNQGHTRTASSDFVEALTQVELSGNARQLENIVRRALLHKLDDAPLSLSDLTPAVWEQLSETINLEKDGPGPPAQVDLQPHFVSILDSNGWNLSRSLEYCERLLLQCALKIARGNQSQTARLIGITPRSVYNKLHKHNLDH